ncbi:MAG: flagellar motor protein MotB [Runella slithyformis]|nr:MAG: flagellar motor protein MotB [Runella slithyformis]TAF29434.1 MAG: flagellar motor protein MotB [Runella slithyformis]TAF48183.1 MAG: flagellar motor protein MotB [Runella slithyformis]TAF81657.1 MAG: flagellar motor protein MotB [Runella slithyformis]
MTDKMLKLKYIFVALYFMTSALAQTATPVQEPLYQQANRQFDRQAYAKAVALYEQVLSDNASTSAQKRQAKINIAHSYMLLGDNLRAEQLYRDLLLEAPFAGQQFVHYLNYAKALANNGKMQESQQYFAQYEAAKTADESGSTSGQAFTKKKITYRLDYLAINTPDAEFSPMYYRDGLVYVSGKSASAVSGESPQKGYLDLYYVPKRAEIAAASTLNPDGSEAAAVKKQAKTINTTTRTLGSDAYTRPTSNDSRTSAVFKTYGLENSPASGGSVSKPGKPMPFSKELNTKYHEGPVSFSADGSRIIFTRNNFNEGKKGQSEENDIKLKLYSAQWGNGDWTNTQELPFNSDEYSTAHPALSKDGNLLYFVSDMPGGVGGKDLYVSQWDGGQWGKPINLGREINSRNDEVFPFFDERGNLYFSTSGRRGGLGGLDIFYAVMSKNGTKVIDIIHLDAPINSKSDDFGIVTDSDRNTGYLSSNRRDGNDDLYRFTRESSLYECRNLTLRVFDNETMQPLDSATITISSKTGTDGDKTIITDENGRAHLCLASDNDFIFVISKEGFLKNTIGFSTRYLTDDKPTRLEVNLSRPTIIADSTAVVVAEPEPTSKPTDWGEPPKDLKKSVIRGVVTTFVDKKPLKGAVVKLINSCTKKVERTITTKANGSYEFEIDENSKCDYTVTYSSYLYATNSVKIKKLPKKSMPKVVTNDINLLKAGDVVQLDNIYYDEGKWNIRPDAAKVLDNLARIMQQYRSLKAEILSHTDSRGEADANLSLSQKRAQAAVNYIVGKGIDKTRLKATGMGETVSINGCPDGVECTEGEYQRNRRTEFRVLSID